MSWVKIDDGAPEHPKLLAAGVAACWLWVCGLAYCNRQKRRDGIIPLAKVKLLYPGLGLKHADALVDAGLLELVPEGYRIHDYHEYQPSEELSSARSIAGRQGGINSGASRRSKREANAKQPNEPRPDPVPSRPDQPQPEAAAVPDPNVAIRCPVPLPIDDTTLTGLELDVGLPRSVATVFFRDWARQQAADAADLRRPGAWVKSAIAAARGRWTSDKAGMRAAAEAPGAPPSPEKTARLSAALAADNARREAEGRAALADFVGGDQ